ncbi:MAG TPA: type II toxin-antitoxin system RelE/ParE family toxin [Thermodesulfovibrionales bacterium]|nr:type II toxin-antitoxin system RelE/ParE family toxin [Thermodesulfovibrionales bacterium]
MSKVEWEKEALDDLQKIDKPIVKRILNKISWLSRHFNNITPETLSGDMSGLFKLRVGDWRVVYAVEKDIIVIEAVGHRREIYRL